MSTSVRSAASWTPVLFYALAFAALFAFTWVQLRNGGVFFTGWAGDTFIPVEGVLHLQRGEQPHLHFPTPIGSLYYFVHYATTWFAPLSTRTIVYADVVVEVLIASLTLLTMRNRLPAVACAFTSLYLAFVAGSPRQLGEFYQKVTYNASYNRFGWAAIGLLCLVLFLPRMAKSVRHARLDGAVAGLLLFTLFHLKASYFLVGGGLAVFSLLTLRRSDFWQFLASMALSWLGLMLVMEIATGATLAYLADLRTAAAAQIDPIRRGQFIYMVLASLPGTAAVAALALIANWLRSAAIVWWETILCPLAIIAAGVALGTQNHLALENPLVPIAGIVAWYALRPVRLPSDQAADAALLGNGLPKLAGQVVLVILFAQPLALDAASALWTRSPAVSRENDLAWLDGTPLSDLRLHVDDNRFAEIPQPTASPLEEPTNEIEHFYVIHDGYALLQKHDLRSGTVFSMSWTNPFPTLLGLPAGRHNLPWWDPGRTFTATVKPDPVRLFEDVAYVVIPKSYVNYYATRALREIYGEYVDSNFAPVDESRFWILLARKNGSPPLSGESRSP